MISCKFCGKLYNRANGCVQHEKYCSKNPNKAEFKQPYKLGFCQYCGKELNAINGLIQHERYCTKNPKHIIQEDHFKTYRELNGSWNRGLTKESDTRVKAFSIERAEQYASGNLKHPWSGRHHTESTKSKISEALKIADHANKDRFSHGRKGYYDGIFFMSSYELAFYIYVRDLGHQIKRCSQRFKYFWEGSEHYYTPDFIVNEIYIIETKGYERAVDLVKYNAVPGLIVLHEADLKDIINRVKQNYNVKELSDLYENT